MSDSFLDHLGGPEKERIIKRLRSPEAYERMREKVKGPEDLEQELERADRMAELHFALESDPSSHEKMKAIVERSLKEGGIDASIDDVEKLSDGARSAIAEGRFRLAITPEETFAIVPEGNVHEKIPVKLSLMESCMSQLSRNA